MYSKDGQAPTLTDMQGGGRQPHIVEVEKMEKQIVDMRGRDKDNPNDRTSGNTNLEQRLEPNSQGISNTITSVQKDNLVLEKKSIKIRQATKQGFIECEVPGVCDLNYADSTTRRGRVIEGGQVSPTLTTENIPDVLELGNPEFYNFLYEIDGSIYLIRIRKLIPLECGRLMGVDDESINKILEVNSNTQAYKQFGNSIVVDVLCAAFSQLGIKGVEKWNDKYKE